MLMRSYLWIIIISASVVILVGSLLYYPYRSQPIPTQVRPFYSAYTMTEFFTKNQSGFNSVQISYNKYVDPVNATTSIMANGPHKFNNCDIIYQTNGRNKVLFHYENITNRGEGFYDNPTRVLNATNRMIFECNSPYYSLSWPYLTLNGIVSPTNTVLLNGKFEPETNITMTIYSCIINACDVENRHLIVEKSVLANHDGDFTYPFIIPQTSDDLLFEDFKIANKEYTIGTELKIS